MKRCLTTGRHALAALCCTAAIGSTGCTTAIDAMEVADLMETQRRAWNRGDLAGFVAYYHPSMTFCGSSGVTRGTEDLLERYRRSYPTEKERGTLSFKVTDIRSLGRVTALVLGEYAIDRADPTTGFFTLIVERTPQGLRIIHDHTSPAESR